jgi:hypothetical protein
MNFLNPFEPLAGRWKGKLNLQNRILYVLLLLPAICAGLIFPLIPDYFEAISLKASKLLDVIELGRARPWVIFTGMPYPATLRLFGDVSGVVAVLLVLVFLLSNPVWLVTASEKWKEKIKNPNSSYWYASLGFCLFMGCFFMCLSAVYFIFHLPTKIGDPTQLIFYIAVIIPVKVVNPSQLVFYIAAASIMPYFSFLLLFLSGYILYCRFFITRRS